MENGNVILYDWVSITSKIHSPQNLIDLLGLKDANWSIVNGAHGYRQRLYWDCISIHFDGRDDMGIWLEVSGQGCRSFETYGTGDFESLFDLVRDDPKEVHLTRLDVAFDDHTGLLDIDTLRSDTEHKELVSKSSMREIHLSFKEMKDLSDLMGICISIGSMKSDVYIRIYDKAAERGYVGRHWTRVELQLRRDRAVGFISAAGELGCKFRGVLHNYCRYVEPDALDSNRWRWPLKDYWARLLDGVGKIQIAKKPGAEYNLFNLETFVLKNCGNAIDTYLKIYGPDKLLDELKHRGQTLPPKYQHLLDLYRLGGLRALTEDL